MHLLFSDPAIGPASAFATSGALPADLQRLLKPFEELESGWLQQAPNRHVLQQHLQRHRWKISWQHWEETLEIPLSRNLIQRWLGPGARYRNHLAETLEPDAIEQLHNSLMQHVGLMLPQRLKHQLLLAQRSPD
jgi:putative ATPase